MATSAGRLCRVRRRPGPEPERAPFLRQPTVQGQNRYQAGLAIGATS